MERDGGVRTRRLITLLAERAHGSSPAPDNIIKLVTDAFAKGGVKKDATKDDANATNILMFVPESTIIAMAQAVKDAHAASTKADDLCITLTQMLGRKAAVPDIALCGRMTELDSDGLFAEIDFHVEACLSAAHAISTHEVLNEIDYFTAVDDRPVGTGAGHVNEAQFNSACFYKHFAIDWDQLVSNLGDDVDLAHLTLRQFILAATMAMPSGKQKSFAAFNPPEGILVEVKTEAATPISYANAFADPVPAKSPRGLIGESIARLGQHVHEINEGYGIQADRFWFSPAGRHALTWIDRNARENKKEKPVILESANNIGALATLVENVMTTVNTHIQPTAGRH